MTALTPAQELRAAAERVRTNPQIADAALAAALAALLGATADWAAAYPEMAHDHDRPACDDYACDVMGRAIDTARTVLTATVCPTCDGDGYHQIGCQEVAPVEAGDPHADCIQPHRTADGYADCDGTPL